MSKALDLAKTFERGYALLPSRLNKVEATNLLLAIGWQESRFKYRAQIGGPARGFWQFERGGGVKGVLEHKLTKVMARGVLGDLQYPSNMDTASVWKALQTDDTLAFCFARLLLYTVPQSLPALDNPVDGWQQYLAAWRPGKPHPDTWADAWAFATYTLEVFEEAQYGPRDGGTATG